MLPVTQFRPVPKHLKFQNIKISIVDKMPKTL